MIMGSRSPASHKLESRWEMLRGFRWLAQDAERQALDPGWGCQARSQKCCAAQTVPLARVRSVRAQ
jgi:hypothetical protein